MAASVAPGAAAGSAAVVSAPVGEAVSALVPAAEVAQPGELLALKESSGVSDLLTSSGVQGDLKSLVEDMGELTG